MVIHLAPYLTISYPQPSAHLNFLTLLYKSIDPFFPIIYIENKTFPFDDPNKTFFYKRIEMLSPPVHSREEVLSTNDIQHVHHFFLLNKSFSFNISESLEKSITKLEKWYSGTARSLYTYPAPGSALKLLSSFPGREREHLKLR